MASRMEVRMRFSAQLQHLSASVTPAERAAYYALKHRDMDEDLHSCILEQLEKNSMNIRANIMYFIEQLCEMATRENHLEFVRMIQRDIMRIVDAAAPADGSGAANVKHVRRVLNGLQSKSILSHQTVVELDACLKERESYHRQFVDNDIVLKPGSKNRADKRQIEQRIEEDRERNKRLREAIWAVPSTDQGELDMAWDDTSDICEDDYIQAAEEAQQRKEAAEAMLRSS